MGMFDYVRCESPLPDGFTGELQTKDFDCEMSTVLIRADGTMAIERFECETVPKAERSFPDAPDDDFCAIVGSQRRINMRWEELPFHGIMNFYGNEGRYGEPGYKWHEYDAKFTDGRLVEILPRKDR